MLSSVIIYFSFCETSFIYIGTSSMLFLLLAPNNSPVLYLPFIDFFLSVSKTRMLVLRPWQQYDICNGNQNSKKKNPFISTNKWAMERFINCLKKLFSRMSLSSQAVCVPWHPFILDFSRIVYYLFIYFLRGGETPRSW